MTDRYTTTNPFDDMANELDGYVTDSYRWERKVKIFGWLFVSLAAFSLTALIVAPFGWSSLLFGGSLVFTSYQLRGVARWLNKTEAWTEHWEVTRDWWRAAAIEFEEGSYPLWFHSNKPKAPPL